jgi:RNA polymerase sigma factor (sigma-70 family)
MPVRPERLLRHIRCLVRGPELDRGTDCSTDVALLKRFVQQRDEQAFAALLARHGPMVLGVCRRVLGNQHDAEDAAQATFLVLARRASTIRPPDRLASWLYGVARHLALKSRRTDARRRRRESVPVCRPQPPDPLDELSGRELLAVLDEELARLPEVNRLAVLLCGVEGLSQEEAARRLGWTTGSVKGRLERGRARLHARLLRRGLTLSAVFGAVEVARAGAAAELPAALGLPTLRAAVAFTAEAGSAVPGTSPEVLALAQKGLQAMYLAKWKTVVVVLAVAGLTGPGVAWLTRGPGSTRQAVTAAEPNGEPPPADVREALDRAQKLLAEATEAAKVLDQNLTRQIVRAREQQLDLEEALREAERERAAPIEIDPAEFGLRDEERQLKQKITLFKEKATPKEAAIIKTMEERLAEVQQRLKKFEARRKEEREIRIQRLLKLRKEMLRLEEEEIRLLERERAMRREEADRLREAAAERVRQLEGFGPPAGGEERSLRSLERKVDALQREVAELRREVQRLQRDKKP